MKRALLPAMALTAIWCAACGDSSSDTVISPLLNPPSVQITQLEPSTLIVGQSFIFQLSAQVNAPEGISPNNAFLIQITPPLGNTQTLPTLDASDIPNCSDFATSCFLDVEVNASSFVSTSTTGSYQVRLSVLDTQGQLADDIETIVVNL